jgi:hypothetical protein
MVFFFSGYVDTRIQRFVACNLERVCDFNRKYLFIYQQDTESNIPVKLNELWLHVSGRGNSK